MRACLVLRSIPMEKERHTMWERIRNRHLLMNYLAGFVRIWDFGRRWKSQKVWNVQDEILVKEAFIF